MKIGDEVYTNEEYSTYYKEIYAKQGKTILAPFIGIITGFEMDTKRVIIKTYDGRNIKISAYFLEMKGSMVH